MKIVFGVVVAVSLVIGVTLKSRNDGAHVQAMLAQAAQQKRIADALERKCRADMDMTTTVIPSGTPRR